MPPVIVSGEYDCEKQALEITFAKSIRTGDKIATVDDAKDLFIRSGVTAFAFEEFKSLLTAKCRKQVVAALNDSTVEFRFASLQDIQGRLTFAGNQPVLVDGQPSFTGASIRSNALIEVPPAVWASVDLGRLGLIEPDPDTKLKLEFNESRVSIWLSRGCVALRTQRGVSGEIYNDKYAPQRSNPQSPGLLKACIAGQSVLTPPAGQFIARLITRNNQPIIVNGDSANTGASVFTGAALETAPDQSASVNLGPLGTLDIAPNTKLVLTYAEKTSYVKVVIVFGCAVLTTKKKTTGEVATEIEGTLATTNPAKGGALDICLPLGGTAATVGQGVAAGAGAGAGSPAGASASGSGGLIRLPDWLRWPASKQEVYPVIFSFQFPVVKFHFLEKGKMNTNRPEEAIRSRGGPSCMRQTSNLRLSCFDGTEINLIPPKRKK